MKQSYSRGRGLITPDAIDLIYAYAIKHGIQHAFLFSTKEHTEKIIN